MGIIKDRNCKDLIEADKIKNHGKNTQKSYTHTYTHTHTILMTLITKMVWSLT